MPELPEVETVRRGLAPLIEGRIITGAHVAQRRLRQDVPEDFERRITGLRVEAVDRRGKALLIRLTGGQTVLVHLGMTGQLTVQPADYAPLKHDHVSLTLDNGNRLVYNDARRFGVVSVMDADEEGAVFASMGPEPLSNHFSAEQLGAAVGKKRVPIKVLLLDQSVVAGVGNIYASEALWRAGVMPDRAGSSLSSAEVERIVSGVRTVLADSIQAGGSTLRDYRQADGGKGSFQERFDVYGRDGKSCRKAGCAGTIEKVAQAGRSTYFCRACQR